MENKAKTVLLQFHLTSPFKHSSANDINSWNQTHDKKIKFKWTSSKKKRCQSKQNTPPEALAVVKKRLESTLDRSTPATGRCSNVREAQLGLICKKVSEFRLPSFENEKPLRTSLQRPNSKANSKVRYSWNRANPLTDRCQSKQNIQRKIRQHLQQLKTPVQANRKPQHKKSFLSMISQGIR